MVGPRFIEDLLKLLIGVVLLIIVNQVAAHFPQRWDLTEEKRYSIQPATKQLLSSLDESVYIDVYLAGELPAGFQRLQTAIEEQLQEFRIHSSNKVRYRFIDPDQAVSADARQEFYTSLIQKGIQASNVIDNQDGRRTERVIFPGAVISKGDQEIGALLLKGNKGSGPDEQLNQSIEGIEYELASAIRALDNNNRKTVALIQGHGELAGDELADLNNSLLERYDVRTVRLSERPNLMGYDAALIVKPILQFSEEDKFKLDQFIVNGGRALFFVDALQVEMDSISGEGTYAFPYETNLDDMLFKYGLRINKDLIVDRFNQPYPLVVGNLGNQANIQWMPWPFYPLSNYTGDHPVVRNLGAIGGKFVSSVDTVKADGISKTPLLFSSQYSMKADFPVKVSLNDLRKDFNPESFNQGPIPFAYLLEGQFTSLYKNRLLPRGISSDDLIEQGGESKVVVVADGDLVRNDVNPKTQQPLPMGFDLASGQDAYANRDFVMNTMSYLLDDQGLITARNKQVKIRPLDNIRIEEERLKWQVLNLIAPLLLVILYGIIRQVWRKRKFASFK